MPTDPLNKFLGCPSAYSADTCWSTSEETYVCPGLSHIYQYRYEPGTGFYNIGADLEYRLKLSINPSWSWFRSSAPTYITYENTCSGVLYSSTGICGDGIIKTTGVCARNSSRSCTADSGCVEGGVDQGPCLYEQCEVGDTRIDSLCTPTTGGSGQRSQRCDSATCRWPATWTTCLAKCGNGVIDVGENCDRGPGGGRIPGGGTSATREYQCNPSCTMTGGWCGDGLLQSGVGERCDDGICTLSYTCANPDGCLCAPSTSTTTTTKSCTVKNGGSSCGNGNYGKVCDNNTAISCSTDSGCPGSTCRPICAMGCVGSAPYCGNTVVDSPREDCDRNLETTSGLCTTAVFTSTSIPHSSFACNTDAECVAEFARRPYTYTNISCNLGGTDSSYCSARYVSGHTSSNISCDSAADCDTGETCDLCPTVGGYPYIKTRVCKNPGESGVTTANQCTWNDWSVCTVAGSCGNGAVEGGEQCDDRNDVGTDACVSCQNSRCGDGQIRTGIEVCDSGAANGTPCSAPYGATCNYCSRECTLRTVSGPVCGDGTVNGAEQCDSRLPASPANWICVDTSNPWAEAADLPAPGCSPSSCAISCATGRACNNSSRNPDGSRNPDDDGDGISNSCDPNDDSETDGCLDDARDCATVNFHIRSENREDVFVVYIDGHWIGTTNLLNAASCDLPDCRRDLVITTLSRGLHNFRIVYISGTLEGTYDIDYDYDSASGTGVDFGVADVILSIDRVGEDIRVDFTVR